MLKLDVRGPRLGSQAARQLRDSRVLARFRFDVVDGRGVPLEQLLHRRFRHEPAAVQDPDPVADTLHVVEDVGRHEDRGRAAEAPDDVEDVVAARRGRAS